MGVHLMVGLMVGLGVGGDVHRGVGVSLHMSSSCVLKSGLVSGV